MMMTTVWYDDDDDDKDDNAYDNGEEENVDIIVCDSKNNAVIAVTGGTATEGNIRSNSFFYLFVSFVAGHPSNNVMLASSCS